MPPIERYDEEAMLRERKRRFIQAGLALVVLLSVSAVVVVAAGGGLIGLWVGVMVAPGIGGLLTWMYLRWAWRRRPRASVQPGSIPCPSCRSLQTDIIEVEEAVGERRAEFVCFNCGARGAPPL